jgi:hypothetical protein
MTYSSSQKKEASALTCWEVADYVKNQWGQLER